MNGITGWMTGCITDADGSIWPGEILNYLVRARSGWFILGFDFGLCCHQGVGMSKMSILSEISPLAMILSASVVIVSLDPGLAGLRL